MRKKTHEEFCAQLAAKHQGAITLQGGSRYEEAHAPIAVHCEVCDHNWVASTNNLLKGNGCPACAIALVIARNNKITQDFVGCTTSDGHEILEHIGYRQSPSQALKGKSGEAIYRYKCYACGNTNAVGRAGSLKKTGHTTHCGCQKSKREHIGKFLSKPDWANSLAHYYIFTVNYDLQFKLGIARDVDRRGQYNPVEEERYLSPIFISQKLPRSWVWVAEQIILKKTAGYLAPVPEEWDPNWGGKSELRNLHLDVDEVVMDFYSLIEEIAQSDFHSVYKKYMRNAL